jgi:hypothetical protein
MAKEPGSKISRRRFAQVTAVTAAAAIAPAALFGQTGQPPQPAAPPPASAETKPLGSEQQAEAQAQAANIFRKYGERLNDAQRADILRQLREGQKPLAELRAFPLENAEAPATVLRLRPRSSGA